MRRCTICKRPEVRDDLGFTNIAPRLGICVDCTNKLILHIPRGRLLATKPSPRTASSKRTDRRRNN